MNWEVTEDLIKLNGEALAFRSQHDPKLTGAGMPNPYYWYVVSGLDTEKHTKVNTAIMRAPENADAPEILKFIREEFLKS